MRRFHIRPVSLWLACALSMALPLKAAEKPVKLAPADFKLPVVWGAECTEPAGAGLAFGGCATGAEDGRPHTRIQAGGVWKSVLADLRAHNPLQAGATRAWAARQQVKQAAARLRSIYLDGLSPTDETTRRQTEVAPFLIAAEKELTALTAALQEPGLKDYARTQADWALPRVKAAAAAVATARAALTNPITPQTVAALTAAQIELEKAAEACDCEPAGRALSPLAYDAKSGLYVLFGGDHLDYLTNDTWVFDPKQVQWRQLHPVNAPAPRANHVLKADGAGKLTVNGGYTYTSSTSYLGAQYAEINDGDWVFDVAAGCWTAVGGGQPGQADSRTYRAGPFDPAFFLQGGKPDAARFQATLKQLPLNTWVQPKPPYLPELNRDWGTAVLDAGDDLMLRWSGGHSAHGGSDVLLYHFATNRWELPFPVEFPLGQLYSNTSYPDTWNFNRRPWVSGHTYLNYAFDDKSSKMVFTGQQDHFYVFDPRTADWIDRGDKPAGMKYYTNFYTLNCCATSLGVICWTQNREVFRFDGEKNTWEPLKTTGKAPGSSVDNSVSVFDSKRDRLLMFSTPYGKPYDAQVYALDLKSLAVAACAPVNMAAVAAGEKFGIDRAVYDPENDLVLMATVMPTAPAGAQRMPAYDCTTNTWVTLTLQCEGGKPDSVPQNHSCGVMYDAGRKLIWGVNTHSQISVLRLDAKTAGRTEIK